MRTEERRMRREPWKYAGKPKFDPKTERSLYRSIELFINQLKQHMRYVGDMPETRELIFKRAVIQLPFCLAKLYDDIDYGGMESIKELERELKNNERQLIQVCTPEESRQLRRDAASRLEKMKNHTLSFGYAETECGSSDSYDSGSDSADSDRRRRKRHKARRRRQRTKRKETEKVHRAALEHDVSGPKTAEPTSGKQAPREGNELFDVFPVQ